MTNSEKAQLRRELRHHLSNYRAARYSVMLYTVRQENSTPDLKRNASLAAVGIAETLDRLGGRTG